MLTNYYKAIRERKTPEDILDELVHVLGFENPSVIILAFIATVAATEDPALYDNFLKEAEKLGKTIEAELLNDEEE